MSKRFDYIRQWLLFSKVYHCNFRDYLKYSETFFIISL